MKSYAAIILCIYLQKLSNSQHIDPDPENMPGWMSASVLDGAYVRENVELKNVVPYPYLAERDVMWSRRVWQVIDMREKMNHPLYFPIDHIDDRNSLFRIIIDGLLQTGDLAAFSTGPDGTDDEFQYPMTYAEIDSLLNPVVARVVVHPDTGDDTLIYNREPVESSRITQFRIKEDWIFDKQRGQRYVRTIGIAPMMEDYDDNGEKRGYKLLFWIYFPQLRYHLQNERIFNPHNDAQRISFNDYFEKRMFSAYVVKESNVYDRPVSAYAKGMDAILESERIKQELFIQEHDLWHY